MSERDQAIRAINEFLNLLDKFEKDHREEQDDNELMQIIGMQTDED